MVVAKTALNSGKSTIDGGFRERFEPLAMDGERIASSSFAFSQFTGLYYLSSQCGISCRSAEWGLEPLSIVDLPEFDPVFSTSRVEIRLSRRFWSGAASHSGAAVCSGTPGASGAVTFCPPQHARKDRDTLDSAMHPPPALFTILIKPSDTLSFDSKGGGRGIGSNLAD